jgi:hypothetical protein
MEEFLNSESANIATAWRSGVAPFHRSGLQFLLWLEP